MIMKNEEAELAIVLGSASPFVDEVIIYDTGSTDGSVPLARSLGATVIEGYWDNDFSRARNAALDHCTGEWILWLDADESLHGDAAAFRNRLGHDRDFDSYLLPIESIEGNGLGAHTVFRAARVFRRSTCHWHGPIHEQIGLRDTNSVPHTTLGVELRILHRGYTQIKSESKDLIQRNLEIARAALADPSVDRARALFDYGRTLTQTDEPDEAMAALREAIDLTNVPTIRRGSLRTIFFTQLGLRRFDDAEETLEELRRASRTTLAVETLRARLLLAREEFEECLEVVDQLPFVDTDDDGMEYGRNSVAQVKARALSALGRPSEAADALLETLRTHGQLDGDLGTLVRLLLAGERPLAEIAERARPESMPVLVAMAGRLPAFHADDVLSAFVERYPSRLEPLAAASKIAAYLPIPRAMWWSNRLRQVGLNANCPLLEIAQDHDNDPLRRLTAAAAGYLAFADERVVEPARAAFRLLAEAERGDARDAVAGISPPLAALLGTTTVAVVLGRDVTGGAGLGGPQPDRLGHETGSVHTLDGDATLASFVHDEASSVLGEWARVLCAGGRAIFEVPDLVAAGALLERRDLDGVRRLLYGEHPRQAPHRDAWTKSELEQVLPGLGFDIESVESLNPKPALRVSARRRALGVRRASGPVPPATVVVVASDGRDRLLAQLRCLSGTDAGCDFETVVLVNGPDPGSLRLLDALGGDVTAAYSALPLDWSAAVNEAVRLARADSVVVLARATALSEGWLRHLLRPLGDVSVGLVGTRLVDEAGIVAHAGYDLAASSNTDRRMTLVARDAYLRASGESYDADIDVDALGAECFALRAAQWHELRGLAPGWSTPAAIVDLGLRARACNLRSVVAGGCSVQAPTLDEDSEGTARLARHWEGKVSLKAPVAKRMSASSLMPATSLIERLAGDLPVRSAPLSGGVNLVGAFTRSRVRAYQHGLESAGLSVSRLGWDGGLPEVLDGEPLPFAATLLVLHGDQLSDYFGEVGIDSLRQRQTILAWDWPLGVAGSDVAATSSMVTEIWVPSAFSEAAVAAAAARPVFRVPPPLALSETVGTVVDPDTSERLFLTVARPSWGRRRDLDMANPRAAVAAFCAAFGAGSGPRLQVVLTGGRSAGEAEACRDLAGARTDVSVIETDDEAEIAALAANAHCYISLHRSSAFNLDLARALGSGRPVVATRYGGPMDYLREDNAELVGFELVPLRGQLLEMVPGGTWADPDIDEAARALRTVTLDYREASQRAWLGRSLITRTYTRRNVNKTLLRRLAFVAGVTAAEKTHPQSRVRQNS